MYYPESQITKNIHSNGELIYKSTGIPYVGYYYKVSSGLMFDKEPNNPLTQELINRPTQQINSSRVIDSVNVYNYLKLTKEKGEIQNNVPKSSYTIPTQNDYIVGEFKRYFCRKSNELIYMELNKETFDKLKNKNPELDSNLYLPFDLRWRITGTKEQVYSTNKKMVEFIINSQKMYNFNLYLKEDYTKYLVT